MEAELDALAAETSFSGAVRVDGADGVRFEKAYGLAHRGYAIPNEVDTRFATASATKGLTALAVVPSSRRAGSGWTRPRAPCSAPTSR